MVRMTVSTTIVDRLSEAIRDIKAEHRSPVWIILGQAEWSELTTYFRRLGTAYYQPPGIAAEPHVTFWGVPIAVIPGVTNHFELVTGCEAP